MISDIQIIREIKQGDYHNFEVLAERHSGICFSLSKPYIIASSGSLSFSDIQSQYPEIILNAAESFDENLKYKPSTWIGQHTRFFCLNQLNQLKQPNIFAVGEDIQIFEQKEEPEQDFGDIELVKHLLVEYNDPKTTEIINKRYFSGSRKPLSYKEIGGQVGLSYEGVRVAVNKFILFCQNQIGNELVMV